MRFIKRAAKRVFRGAKKVAKKIARPAAIAGLVFLTAGIGVAGFGALNFGGTFGAFMSSVGSTMMAGAQGIAGAVGIGSGLTAGTAGSLQLSQAAIGTNLFTGAAAQAMGLAAPAASSMSGLGPLSNSAYGAATKVGSTSLAGLGGAGTTAYSSLTATKTGSTFFGGLGKALSGQGNSLAWAGVLGGARAWQEQRAYKRERKVQKGLNIFGGPAHGGDSSLPFDVPSFTSQEPSSTDTTPELGSMINDPDNLFSDLFDQDDFMNQINQPSPLFRGFA